MDPYPIKDRCSSFRPTFELRFAVAPWRVLPRARRPPFELWRVFACFRSAPCSAQEGRQLASLLLAAKLLIISIEASVRGDVDLAVAPDEDQQCVGAHPQMPASPLLRPSQPQASHGRFARNGATSSVPTAYSHLYGRPRVLI